MRQLLSFSFIILIAFSTYAGNNNLTAVGYDSHVELRWDNAEGTNYRIYAKEKDASEFILRGETSKNCYLDFTGDIGRNITLDYKIEPIKNKGENITVSVRDFTDEELLEMIQRYSFRYFWNNGDTNTGLSYERTKDSKGKIVTIGGSGFGIMGIIVGVERGWITREQAVERLLKATQFLQDCPRFHGMWAHWYNAENGTVCEFGEMDNGGDIVESAFMAQALLTVHKYFDGKNAYEKQLNARCTQLWEDMDWAHYTNGGKGLIWHWSPTDGFKKNHIIRGYNECMIAYILAVSHPKHAIDPSSYHEVWAGWGNENFANYSDYYGITLPLGNKEYKGGPLFFAHYSYMGLDPRGLKDRYADYWQQNRRQTLINRAYCIDNPYGHTAYGADFWGLTACDKVPTGYSAHAPGYRRDLGTIAPTAALSSMPYTPKESMKVLKNLYRNLGKDTFGPYGFYDSINQNLKGSGSGYVRQNYIAIDQGPILVMIENYRSGLIWKYFMQNNEILVGLNDLGFTRHGEALITE